jgi:hypothetical protein
MDAADEYLCLPAAYGRHLGGLRWSPSGDAIDLADGSTFAFSFQIGAFLEGYLTHGPPIPFGYVLHLMGILRRQGEGREHGLRGLIRQAFQAAGRSHRNAGAFFATVCRDVPPVPGAPVPADLLWRLQYPPHGVSGADVRQSEAGVEPPRPPEWFEAHVVRALESYGFDDYLHWFRHGTGPDKNVAPLAQAVAARPPSLAGVLAELARSPRLAGAMPYVDRFVGALTLPRRKLDRHELPVGGYDDITTRGNPAQLLPGQLALEPHEFVRRFAERELLYFRREEPHARTRDELVVLLDQGVRTWGPVRLMLAAATLALGRYAERRRLTLRVAASSGPATLDPLTAAPAELAALVEASDLSPHPGRALERVLEAAKAPSDVVLLTHPRNLAEPDVGAASRRVARGVRLFALTVTAPGDAELSEIRHGTPVSLSKFRAEPDTAAPAAPPAAAADPRVWKGDVEHVPYPFVFGTMSCTGKVLFAFDHAGDWLLTAVPNGMLHAMRTDGTAVEVWPRPARAGTVLPSVEAVVGVAGGFVVGGVLAGHLMAAHYDMASRMCRLTDLGREHKGRAHPTHWWYIHARHTVVAGEGDRHLCIDLSSGATEVRTGAGPSSVPARTDQYWLRPLWSPAPEDYTKQELSWRHVEYAGASEPPKRTHRAWPFVMFDAAAGSLAVVNVPGWKQFTPLSDGRPLLAGATLRNVDCRGNALAALTDSPTVRPQRKVLRVFCGPEGVPVGEYPMHGDFFCLSADGRLLALLTQRGRVWVKDALASGPPRCVTPVGRYHSAVRARFAGRLLQLNNGRCLHLVRWDGGRLHAQVGEPPGDWREGVITNKKIFGWLAGDKRFGRCDYGWLIAAVDTFGQVALFEHDGRLVCMFFTFREQFAAWMPDGTRFGSARLLGAEPTPGAAERIGAALTAAWDRAHQRARA